MGCAVRTRGEQVRGPLRRYSLEAKAEQENLHGSLPQRRPTSSLARTPPPEPRDDTATRAWVAHEMEAWRLLTPPSGRPAPRCRRIWGAATRPSGGSRGQRALGKFERSKAQRSLKALPKVILHRL